MKTKYAVSLVALSLCSTVMISGCSMLTETATPTPSPTSAPSSTPTATPTATQVPTPTAPPTLDPCYDDNPYNGWLYHETCIPGVVSENFWRSPNPHHFVGIATYYGEGIMEKVAARRGLSLDGVRGGVALMNCGDIGSHVWLKRSPQYEFEGPYLVVDCSKREHLYWNVVVNNLAVEVDWQTSRRWGMSGGIAGVHVCKARGCSRYGTLLSSWFHQTVIWEEAPDE